MVELSEFKFEQLDADWQEDEDDVSGRAVKQEVYHDGELIRNEGNEEKEKLDFDNVRLFSKSKNESAKVVNKGITRNVLHERDAMKPDNDGLYFCTTPGCQFKTKTKTVIVRHIKVVKKHQVRNYIPKLSAEDEALISSAVKIDEDGKYFCATKDCKYRGKYKPGLVRHLKVVHLNMVSFICALCRYVSKFNQSLTEHVSAMHEKVKQACKFCDYTSTHKGSISNHMRKTHGNKKQKKCLECTYETFSNDMLKNHINGKHLKKLLFCDQCDFQTTWESGIRSHNKKYHEKESFQTKCE